MVVHEDDAPVLGPRGEDGKVQRVQGGVLRRDLGHAEVLGPPLVEVVEGDAGRLVAGREDGDDAGGVGGRARAGLGAQEGKQKLREQRTSPEVEDGGGLETFGRF